MPQDYFGRGPAWNFHHGGHDSWSSWKETDFLCRVQSSGRYLIAPFLSLLLPLSLSFSLPFLKICFNAFQKQFSLLVFFERIWLCVSEGESAFLDVHDCGVQQQAPVPGNIRRYYMMVDEYLWDYAPTGMDMYSGTPLISEDRWDISATWPFLSLLLKLFSVLSHKLNSLFCRPFKVLMINAAEKLFQYEKTTPYDKNL